MGASYDVDMDVQRRSELRSYYDEEARHRSRQQPTGRRVVARDNFITLLNDENRHSVLDFGAGPASDALAFNHAGLYYLGLDLAHGNSVLAAANNHTVIQASIEAPPIKPASFDAGWSMSTLMHLAADEALSAIRAIGQTLRSGAPFLVGLWGGTPKDLVDTDGIEGERRFYSLRSVAQNRRQLETIGRIEQETIWDTGPPESDYQVFLVRVD